MKSRALVQNEIKSILSQITNIRDKSLIVLSANTGLRASEIVSLKLNQVAQFTSAGIYKGIRDVIYITTKGGKLRSVKINSITRKTLDGLVKSQVKKGGDKDSFLFTKNNKKQVHSEHLTRNRFYSIVKTLSDFALGITTGISCHSFRKSFATKLYSMTKDLLFVQSCLGHESVNTTTRYISGSLGIFADNHIEKLELC